MTLNLNTLFLATDIAPSDVRLLRHQDSRSEKGKSPYELWRDNKAAFEFYQSGQSFNNRAKLRAKYWASFVVNSARETILAGFYKCKYKGTNKTERPWPNANRSNPVGTCDVYELREDNRVNDFAGRLIIKWGSGTKSWIQRADNQNKPIVELRQEFIEPQFPGFANFIQPLSSLERLPATWVEVLRSCSGIYLLTCPRTGEQYVGQASGKDGFYGRWLDYLKDGHGGNVELKSRNPSDYQISILQVAGDAEAPEIKRMEGRWKRKLQSREMGLNRNL